jgi:ADP-heptose:LPS heptosyltransferase
MRGARFFVGHDSGPLHLAAGVGVPCVGIYGDYNKPKCWHPMGTNHRIVHDIRGMPAIRPEDVFSAVLRMIEDTNSQRSLLRHLSFDGQPTVELSPSK